MYANGVKVRYNYDEDKNLKEIIARNKDEKRYSATVMSMM